MTVFYILYKTEKKSLDNIYDLAETGDIIFFRWIDVDLHHDIISSFTHIGMVIIIDNEKFIIETHLQGDTENMGILTGGVHIYPLKLRISKYNGHTFLSKLKNKPTEINISQFLKKINTYREIPFKDDYKHSFINNCLKNRICKNCFEIKSHSSSMMCSEFIGFCLKELKITDDLNYNCMVPSDFQFIKKNNEYIFSDIIKIL